MFDREIRTSLQDDSRGSPDQIKESKSNELVRIAGHVTETVAKFEESLYIHGDKKIFR